MIQCKNCSRPYPQEDVHFVCPVCRGIYEYSEVPYLDRELIDNNQPGIWKYQHTFNLPKGAPIVSLGEGNTPLVWSEVNGREVAFKIEYQNPTGSFKDRGTAVLTSFLLSRDTRRASEDSSGNAGASFAAYAAHVGITAQIFVPDWVSQPKRKQIEAYGSKLTRILGPRSNAAEAVRRQIESGDVYASHVYLPFNIFGYSTISYEIFDQLGEAPGTIVMPTGQGGLLLGVGRGFEILKNSGEIDRIPQLVGIQARACAPLWAVYNYGQSGLMWVSEGETIAEGIQVRNPIRGDSVLKMVRETGGMLAAVDEDEISAGQADLSRRGFYVEPAAAVVWKPLWNMITEFRKPIVVLLTGSGLKS